MVSRSQETGRTVSWSGTRVSFRLRETRTVKSSTHFFLAFSIGFRWLRGCVMISPSGQGIILGPARSIMKQKMKNPIGTPWPAPP